MMMMSPKDPAFLADLALFLPEWRAARSANILVRLAEAADRVYVTPEDVRAALSVHPYAAVQKAVLECLGRKFAGLEDASLCAFIAIDEPETPEDSQDDADEQRGHEDHGQ